MTSDPESLAAEIAARERTVRDVYQRIGVIQRAMRERPDTIDLADARRQIRHLLGMRDAGPNLNELRRQRIAAMAERSARLGAIRAALSSDVPAERAAAKAERDRLIAAGVIRPRRVAPPRTAQEPRKGCRGCP